MKKTVEQILENFQASLGEFYQKRKDQFLVFTFLAVLLLYFRVNPIFPYYLTDRKIFFILWIFFFLVFKVSYRIVAVIGLVFLLFVSLFSFLGFMGAVNKLIVYAWAFLLLAGLMQIFELWAKK